MEKKIHDCSYYTMRAGAGGGGLSILQKVISGASLSPAPPTATSSRPYNPKLERRERERLESERVPVRSGPFWRGALNTTS